MEKDEELIKELLEITREYRVIDEKRKLGIAEAYYHQLLTSDIRTLGEIGCIELAIALAQWLYPRILREAYAERSKSYMLAP